MIQAGAARNLTSQVHGAKLRTICVICAICGSNCLFRVHLSADAADSADGGAEIIQASAGRNLTSQVHGAKLQTICVICAICGSNCLFRVHLSADAADSADGGAELIREVPAGTSPRRCTEPSSGLSASSAPSAVPTAFSGFIYPQMSPIPQMVGQNSFERVPAGTSPRRCTERPIQAPDYLRHLRNLRIKLLFPGSLNRRCRRFRRWWGRIPSSECRQEPHLAGAQSVLSKLLIICVICAICGSNCFFQVHLTADVADSADGGAEFLQAGAGRNLTSQVHRASYPSS